MFHVDCTRHGVAFRLVEAGAVTIGIAAGGFAGFAWGLNYDSPVGWIAITLGVLVLAVFLDGRGLPDLSTMALFAPVGFFFGAIMENGSDWK
jgi:hypothetical protein